MDECLKLIRHCAVWQPPLFLGTFRGPWRFYVSFASIIAHKFGLIYRFLAEFFPKSSAFHWVSYRITLEFQPHFFFKIVKTARLTWSARDPTVGGYARYLTILSPLFAGLCDPAPLSRSFARVIYRTRSLLLQTDFPPSLLRTVLNRILHLKGYTRLDSTYLTGMAQFWRTWLYFEVI